MNIHKLKCWPEYFTDIKCGKKTFELRQNDRDYQLFDELWLEEFNPCEGCNGTGQTIATALGLTAMCPVCYGKNGKYTGKMIIRSVDYIMRGPSFGLPDGWVIMAIKPT